MGKRLLVVDDSELVRDVMTAMLIAKGHDVVTAGTYDELMTRLPGAFDLILMDVHMPELYGDDVAAVLRHERGLATPIYMLSSLPPDELAQRTAEAGVDGYISKLDGLAAVVARVEALLAER